MWLNLKDVNLFEPKEKINNIEKNVGDLTVLFIWLSFFNVNDIAGEETKNDTVKDYFLTTKHKFSKLYNIFICSNDNKIHQINNPI